MKRLIALLVAALLSIGTAFAAVNVNTATSEELQTLNGIGPVKAKAIIDYRTKNGNFKSYEDLDKVPGIGEGTIGKIKADVTFSGKTTVTKAAAKKDVKADTKSEMKKDVKADVKADAKSEMKKDTKDTKAATK
jgi:competence protein ComEA